MMFRTKLAVLASSFLFAGSLFAADLLQCPDIKDIQAEGLSVADRIFDDLYFAYNLSQYNTEMNWGFVIAPITANSADEALSAGNEVLSSLMGPGVITQTMKAGFYCDYKTNNPEITAAAIPEPSMSTLKGHVKKHPLMQRTLNCN